MKTYNCKRIKESINIDGDVNKREWEGIEGVSLVETASGNSPKQETTIKMMWNDTFLYIAFQCTDTYINATKTGYNDTLYDEEVVEAFIDDNSDLKTYIEINVNPLNALLHYYIHNDSKGNKASYERIGKHIITAVDRDDSKGFWNVEIALPFSEFVTAPNIPPQPGDSWRMNLYRIDRPQNGEDEYSAWSPTGKISYHMPEKFGKIIFTI